MQQQPQVVMAVNAAEMCAAGGVHSIQDEFTCCGIAMAIIFFPVWSRLLLLDALKVLRQVRYQVL
ncbi:hypothetical protein BC829DRAFT_382132, partial [Chytridium lagenaria]